MAAIQGVPAGAAAVFGAVSYQTCIYVASPLFIVIDKDLLVAVSEDGLTEPTGASVSSVNLKLLADIFISPY